MPQSGTQTLVLVKPDGVQRRLVGQCLARFETAGLTVSALDLRQPGRDVVERHYREHDGKDFYANLVDYLADSSVAAAVFSGDDAVSTARDIVGDTNPADADTGTIRGDLGQDSMEQADREDRALQNVVHASEDADAARREISLWFPDYELPADVDGW